MTYRIHAALAAALNRVAESYLYIEGGDHPAVTDFLAALKEARIECVELPTGDELEEALDEYEIGLSRTPGQTMPIALDMEGKTWFMSIREARKFGTTFLAAAAEASQ
ncbi:hypothetical protein [Mycolicibacterium sp. XJ775]